MAEFIGIDGNEKFKDELGQLYRARLKELEAGGRSREHADRRV